MHHPSSRHLALVENRPEPEGDPIEAHPALAVAHRLEEILRQRRPTGAADAASPASPALGTKRPADRLPFAVRLTMVQILEVAEDAEIRAEILDDVTFLDARRDATVIRRVESPDQIQRRVDSLREVAGDLRSIAAQIVDRWAGPERSS